MRNKNNVIRVSRFAQALASVPAVLSIPDYFVAVMKNHVQITGTERESAASQRSDLLLNMLHFLADQPQFAQLSRAELRSAAQREALADGLKLFLQEAQQCSCADTLNAVEKFWHGFAAHLLQDGTDPLEYLDFKMFDFIDELTECAERMALFGKIAH